MKIKSTLNLFSLPPLMSFDYEGDMDKIIEFVANIDYRKSVDNIKSDDCYILENPELSELKEFCLKCVSEYTKQIVSSSHEINIQQSWVNYNKPGQQHRQHYHGNSIISGVFYIMSDQESGSPIIFKSDLHKSNFSILLDQDLNRDTYNPYRSSEYPYPSIPGELILFSSMLSHYVPENISDKPRVSLSFNTYPEVPFGSEIGLTKVK
tara:strand:- start:644 stop:1267 length:624 start_codon:yes stop_codon:yes gene_type:complete